MTVNETSQDYDEQISHLKKKMDKILQQKIHNIKDVQREKEKYDVKGVYLIRRPDTSEIVYVGKTKAGISNRMQQHIYLKETSDLNIMIKKFSEFPQEVRTYLVQYFEIPNDRERGIFENFLVSVIDPILNKVQG